MRSDLAVFPGADVRGEADDDDDDGDGVRGRRRMEERWEGRSMRGFQFAGAEIWRREVCASR